MGPRWADKAAEEIEADYEAGHISNDELAEALRDLREEMHEEASNAYNDAMYD